MKTLINYIRDTKGEMKHVSWPTRHQTVVYTALVIVLSIILAVYLGLFDFLFTEGVSLTI
jgi:preprotein translocase subunit SecE